MNKLAAISLMRDFVRNLGDATGDNTMPTQQLTLLLSLYSEGEVSQSKLEELTGVKRSSNSRNISKLGMGEKPLIAPGPGLVENTEDLTNRSTKLVRLTPKGRLLLETVYHKTYDRYNTLMEARKGEQAS